MNSKCIYYVEGPCEQQLIASLKENPAKLISGKVKVFNVVQNLIPKSQMLSIQAGTIVILVFDTDVPITANLLKIWNYFAVTAENCESSSCHRS